MFDKLLEKCLCENKRWTIEKANQFLKEVESALSKAGYKAKVIGSVAKKGWSDHDLDLLLTPVREDFDFEILDEYFGGMECGSGSCWARIDWNEEGKPYKADYPYEEAYYMVEFFFEERSDV